MSARGASSADNRLVRVVQRFPTGVRFKLLAALFSSVGLVIVIGLLGLRVIAESNDRAEVLRLVQQRATSYRALQSNVEEVRILLGLRAGGSDLRIYTGAGASPPPSSASLAILDQTIASTAARLGAASDPAQLDFEPAPDQQDILGRIGADNARLGDALVTILELDRAGRAEEASRLQGVSAEPLVHDLESLSDALVAASTAETNALIDQNRAALEASERTFVAVVGLSVALAVILGYALARSVIGPIRRIEAQLAAIASGDFSEHVDVPNRDELGSLASNLNRMNDELGRLYAQLETASRHKSEFLANMSHELRTPLNAVIGFSEVLRAEMFGPLNATQRQYVTDVLDAGQHLLSLINDILDLSKVEAGRMDLVISDVPVLETLESGLTMHRARADRDGIKLRLDVDPGVGTVHGDERRIRQVVFNLVSNAVKFTPAGGRVEVSARAHDGVVEIAVADSGIGISPDDQERIFEEFQQARLPNGGSIEGTGLGLALSKRFVELHGGRLWVQSELGSGTTFRFTLPSGSPT
jgi:signal transduction histidine kinase